LQSGRKRAKNTTWLRTGVRIHTELILGLVLNTRVRPALCNCDDQTWVGVRCSFLFSQIKTTRKDHSMTLVIYLLGWLILIGGVSWALVAMHVAQHTIMIVDVILLGIAVITGATRARNRDRS
jgi:hypothetical protein